MAPTSYAQADLDALQRVGDPGLSAIATNAGDIVDQLLGITATRGASIVGDGPLTGPAVELLSAQGPTVAIAAADFTGQDSDTGEAASADLNPLRYTPQLVAAPFDPTVGAALAGAAPTRLAVVLWTPRSTFRSSTTPRWPAARMRLPPCCGAGCNPTPNPAPRS